MSDLVVDCAGMTSDTSNWLKSVGIEVEVSTVKSDLAYASTVLELPEHRKDFKGLYVQQCPPDVPYGVICFGVNSEVPKYMLSTISLNKGKLPRTLEELREHIKDMPLALELVDSATSMTPLVAFKKEGNVYKKYEKLDLKGFVALGDSVCNFNPAYGQGITTVCEAILLLDEQLRGDTYSKDKFCGDFQNRLSRVLTLPWLLAVLNDLRFPNTTTSGTSGNLTKFLWLTNPMMGKLLKLTAVSTYVYKSFLQVMHMQQGFLWGLFDPILFYELVVGSNPHQGW